ncbi:glycoside hydrolase family 43 protein [Streptomyces sp. DSM 44915]|uniref:Glycoside hydrolase family 43 protein n=1 Tax=Streptomyces chisholmiae TaxID=3075540 RepID=A0ABU2JJ91_9ACTN|nr:glycoside hydrolase family 43 protein [Streptomyces sp. DSM 44915]MDT0264744.1 glycoside hydrolase family 43 protein [Streptomyces sp. DSM 44915]
MSRISPIARRSLAAAGVLALASLLPTVPAAQAHSAPRLVIDGNFPDPEVVATDGALWAYATNAEPTGDPANPAHNVQTATAPGPEGPWTRQADALPVLGDWARPGLTWAPEVAPRPDGGFVMYYTARDVATERQCVGTAVSDTPAGPFTPVGDGPLVCPADEGGAIDAGSFTDEDGTPYLLYKNDGNAVGVDTWIHLQELTPDGLGFAGERVPLLRQDRPAEGGLIEAPTLVQRAGAYVLFYSAGYYGDGTYHTGYATAPALTGPYTKSDEPLMTSENTGITGPGGQDVIPGADGDWLAFHGVLSEEPLVRGMFVTPLRWDGATPSID